MDRVAGDLARGELLAELFRAHHRALLRATYLLHGSLDVAEEIVQESYLGLHRALLRGTVIDDPVAYLRAGVTNRSRSRWRHGVITNRRQPELHGHVQSVDEAVEELDQRRTVIAALGRLPTRQRQCLVLRYYLDLSEGVAAATLGISRNSVKTHVRRGLAAMGIALGGAP